MERLRKFNYFSKPTSTDPTEIKQQIIATRLFFVLLIISFIVLITYYSAVNVTVLYEIESPSFEQFLRIQDEQDSNPSFACPCSTIAMPHETFIQVNYTLHPVCVSPSLPILSSKYGEYLNGFIFDFRLLARPFFLSLGVLCNVSSQHINNRLTMFNTSLFIADKALHRETFDTAIKETILTMTMSIASSFASTFTLISTIINNNKLMGMSLTNFVILFQRTGPVILTRYVGVLYDNSPVNGFQERQ